MKNIASIHLQHKYICGSLLLATSSSNPIFRHPLYQDKYTRSNKSLSEGFFLAFALPWNQFLLCPLADPVNWWCFFFFVFLLCFCFYFSGRWTNHKDGRCLTSEAAWKGGLQGNFWGIAYKWGLLTSPCQWTYVAPGFSMSRKPDLSCLLLIWLGALVGFGGSHHFGQGLGLMICLRLGFWPKLLNNSLMLYDWADAINFRNFLFIINGRLLKSETSYVEKFWWLTSVLSYLVDRFDHWCAWMVYLWRRGEWKYYSNFFVFIFFKHI